MANLQLIGAVGVRVRPDTTGFRELTKRDIMSQLKDMEGDMNVTVDPKIKYNEAKAREAFRQAFKDLNLDQKINIKPVVNEQQWRRDLRQLLRDSIEDPTPIRIRMDTEAAQASIKDLGHELSKLDDELERIPGQLKDVESEYASRMSGIQESIDKAARSQTDFQRDLDAVNDSLGTQRSLVNDLTRTERRNRDEIAVANAEKQQAIKDMTAATERWKEVSGKAAKDEQQAIKRAAQARKKAAEERMKALREDLKLNADMLKTEQKRLDVLQSQSRNLKEDVDRQKKIRRDQEAAAAAALKDLEAQRTALDLTTQTGRLRQKQLAAEIEALEAAQAARKKDNNELKAGLDWIGAHIEVFRRKVALTTEQTGDMFRMMRAQFKQAGVSVRADMDELQKRIQEFGQRRRDMERAEARFRKEMDANTAKWEPVREQNLDKYLGRIKRFADEAEAYIERKTPKFEVRPGLDMGAVAFVDRSLDVLARDREMVIRPKVNNTRLLLGDMGDGRGGGIDFPVRLRLDGWANFSRDVVKGITGIGIAQRITQDFRDALRDIDRLSIGAAKSSVFWAALSSSLLGVTGVVAALAADVGELTGLLLGATAVLSGLGLAAYATKVGFEGFNEAVNGDADALASLSPVAREAARAVGRLNDAVRQSAKVNLWRGIGDSLRDMANAVRGPLVQGMNAAALATGAAWAGIFRSFEKFADSGRMEGALDAITLGMMNASDATEPLFDALLRITDVGARFMPRMGVWATENAEGFRDWAIAADEAGDMDRWMERAIDHSQSLFSGTASLVGIINNLGEAASRAGFGGLAALAAGLESVEQSTSGEFFQTGMSNLFRASLEFLGPVGRGFADLGRTLSEQSQWIERAFGRIGRTVENFLSGLAEAADNPRMLGGLMDLFGDLEEASGRFGIIFDKLANGVGDFGRIAGELVKGAVNIADAFATIFDTSDELTTALVNFIPWVTDTTAALVELAHVPFALMMRGLASLIDGLMSLPEPLRLAALGLAGLVALAPKLNAVGLALRTLGMGFRGASGEIGGWRRTWGTAMGTMSGSGRVFMENSRMLTRQERDIARTAFAWRDARRGITDWRNSVRTAQGDAVRLRGELDNIGRSQRYYWQQLRNGTIEAGKGAEKMQELQRRAGEVGLAYQKAARTGVLGVLKHSTEGMREAVSAWAKGGADSARSFVSSANANLGRNTRFSFEAVRAIAVTAYEAAGRAAGAAFGNGYWREMAGINGRGQGVDQLGVFEGQTRQMEQAAQQTERSASRIRRALSSLPRMFGSVATAVAPAGRAVADMARQFEVGASSITRSVGSGMRAALSGLSAVLGGPWGIALTAGLVALTTFATGAARERQKIEDLRNTFDDLGNTTADTTERIAEDLNSMKASWQDQDIRTWFKDGPDTVGESLKELGLTSRETAEMLVEDRDSYMELAQAMSDLGKGYRPTEEALQRVSELTGISTEKVRENAAHYSEAGKAMLDYAGNVDSAHSAFTTLNGVVYPVSQSAKDLADAFGQMGDEAASAEERVAGLNKVLAELNNDDLTPERALRDMHDAVRDVTADIPNFIATYGDMRAAINDTTGEFELVTEEGSAFSKMLEGMIDKAKVAGVETKDMAGALQEGKQAFIDQAREAGVGKETLDEWGRAWDYIAQGTPESIDKTFNLKGGESVDEAEAFMQKIEGEWNQEEFEAWLQLDSTQAKIEGKDAQQIARAFADDTYLGRLNLTADDAETVMSQMEQRGLEWDLAEFSAWLDANPEMAKLSITDMESVAKAYADGVYRATLDADGETALAMMETLKARGDAFDQARFLAWLGMNSDEFTEKSLSAEEILKRWDSEPHRVRVGLEDGDLRNKITSINSSLIGIRNADYTAKITGDAQNFLDVIEFANHRGTEITDPERFKAWITANADDFKEKALSVQDILDIWENEPAEVKVTGETADADLKIKDLDEKVKSLTKDEKKIPVGVEDKTDEGLNQAKGKLRDNWENLPSYADLEARNNAGQGLAQGVGLINANWAGRLFASLLGADDNTGTGLSSAAAAVGSSWVGRLFSSFLGAEDQTAAGRGAAEGAMGASWVGRMFDALLGAEDRSAPAAFAAAMALGNMWTGQRFDALLTATNMAGPMVQAALATAASFAGQRFAALLEATNNVAAGLGAALATAATFVGRTFAAILDGNPGPFQARLAGAVAQGVGFAARIFRAAFDGNPAQFQSRLAGAIAQGVSFAARTFRAAFDGNPGPFQAQHGAVVSMGAGFAARTFSAAFDATTGGVSAALSVALSIGASWAARRFSAIFDAITPNADGNLWAGGSVQAFAGGGFSNHSIAKVLASRSPSQRESHLAQIAAAKTPFRIWAEPETGGEAYIPLASAKRARSTRIWEETGNRLGVQWEAYADGGTRGGHSSKSATGRGGSGRNVVVNVTTHYPVAEAASITTNRALQLAANLI